MKNLFLTAFLFLGAALAGPVLGDDVPTFKKDVSGWSVECTPQVCLIMRNESAGGLHGVAAKVVGADHKIDNFGFMVGADIDQSKGFAAVFVRTVVDAKRPECAGDKEGKRQPDCYTMKTLDDTAFNGPFDDCDKTACFARIPGQYIGDPKKDKVYVDLLEQFQTEDLIVLLTDDKQDNLKRNAVTIAGFKDAYQAAIAFLK